ncbi:MAG: hypothetical protein Q8L48_20560 [Archangium sp.]|nr:hypothetical protein [Archangium sp.]
MGRPVFHEYTLEGLVAASRLVARVERTEARERIEEREGLRAVLWPLRLVEVLFANEAPLKQGPISRGDLLPPGPVPRPGGIEVLANRVNLVDQVNRRRSPSGASFPAERYRSDPQTVDAAEWITFLVERRGKLEFTAQGAFVPLAELPAVREAIRLAESGLPARQEERRALLAHLDQREGK